MQEGLNQHRFDSLKSKMTKRTHFKNDIVKKIKKMTKQSHFIELKNFLYAKRTHFAVTERKSDDYEEFL